MFTMVDKYKGEGKQNNHPPSKNKDTKKVNFKCGKLSF